MYAATSTKRQKVVSQLTRAMESSETFQGVGRIEYKPDFIHTYDDQLSYRYFNSTERIHGRTMDEWLRPSITYTSEMFFFTYLIPTLHKSLETFNNHRSMEATKKNIRAMFELCLKMGVKFWSGYEDDLIPDGDSFEECQSNYHQITELLNEYQQKTGVKSLWIGVNFQHSRYANGAMTNSDANVMAFAGHQAKRALEMAHKLNAECFLINSHRENYDNSLNTDVSKDLKHYARFLKLIIEQRDKIGFGGQMLFEINHVDKIDRNYQINWKNENHYYTDNAFNAMLLLKHLNYDRYFKVNVRPGHEFNMANAYNCLGCVKVKTHKNLKDITNITLFLRTIIEKGGWGQCGLIFEVPFYNHCYIEAKEVIESYVTALDSCGKALRLAAKMVNDTQINKQIATRYTSYQNGWGLKFMTLEASLQDCEEIVKQLHESRTQCTSTKSIHWLATLQRYVDEQSTK